MEDGLFGRNQLSVYAEIVAAIWVAIKTREIAAGNFETDPMTATEKIGRDPKIDLEFFGLARFEQCKFVPTLSVTSAQNTITQVVSLPVRIQVD